MGEIVKNYTFKQNYYWMMGNSTVITLKTVVILGIRSENHIGKTGIHMDEVGTLTASLNKVRWDRSFHNCW
jgi:signal peptidase I